MASTHIETMRLASMRKRWQDMKMMPGDCKAMAMKIDMKVMKAMKAEKRMAMKARERMSEGYANAKSKLLFEKEAMKRMSEGYAEARVNLLAKMEIAAEKARSSTARSSTARFDCQAWYDVEVDEDTCMSKLLAKIEVLEVLKAAETAMKRQKMP